MPLSIGDKLGPYDILASIGKGGMAGTLACTGFPSPVSSATYDIANELTNWNGTTIGYDANGNLQNDGTNTYSWNARNQLIGISGGVTAAFGYDTYGRRTSKTVTGQATGFVYNGGNATQELNGSTPTANILNGGTDEFFQRTDGNGTVFPLTDALGSVLALTNSAGSMQSQYTYDPFGGTSSSGTASSNPTQYTGREDDSTGLYYYRARYYDPAIGRFISEDPIGLDSGQTNFYAYVGNDPIDYNDPLGLVRRCITKIMLVTAYSDHGPGKDWPYFAPKRRGGKPGSVGLGTVAVANSDPQPYPFGADVTVSGPLIDPVFDPRPSDPFNTPAYVGQVHDTGAGWDADHHHVEPDDWIDIWLPSRHDALNWGTKWRRVTICYEDGCRN